MAFIDGDRLGWRAASVLAAAMLVSPPIIHAEGTPCPWTVASIRSQAEGESAYSLECEASHGDSTGVPSFDSLVVFDRTDSAHHSFVLIKDLRTGRTERLLAEWAMVSCRSPDGRYVACSIYKSHALSSVLVVVDLASGKRIDPLPKAMLESVKWSRDSRHLAFDARTPFDARRSYDEASLHVISFPECAVSLVDTTMTFGSYDFVWSPDSRWLAVARPAGSFHYGDYDLSELWIFSRSGEVRCKVVDRASWETTALAWVADRRILLDRYFLREGEEDTISNEGNIVIELDLDESAERAAEERN